MQLGKYEILEELGKGGFGVVYKAKDTVLEVIRAVKVLHPALVADVTFLARFKQEAQLAAQLEHPNLVPVYDYGESEGRFYLVMKYMPGGSLKDLLDKQGKLDEKVSITILKQASEGVTHAHHLGIIHRDLKPGNILFDEDGKVRISDMGFAKALSGSNSASLSASGGMVGTPAYMAPEIWRGKAAIPATDQYSLGCILFEMLTGEVLFSGESPADVMTKHVLDGPQIDPSMPGSWVKILTKALNPNPEERYSSVEDFYLAASRFSVKKDLSAEKSLDAVDVEIKNKQLYPASAMAGVIIARKLDGTAQIEGSSSVNAANPARIQHREDATTIPKSKPSYKGLWIGLGTVIVAGVFLTVIGVVVLALIRGSNRQTIQDNTIQTVTSLLDLTETASGFRANNDLSPTPPSKNFISTQTSTSATLTESISIVLANTPLLATATNTQIPPTLRATAVPPTKTNTPLPPTKTNTPLPPTQTNTPQPNNPPVAYNVAAPPITCYWITWAQSGGSFPIGYSDPDGDNVTFNSWFNNPEGFPISSMGGNQYLVDIRCGHLGCDYEGKIKEFHINYNVKDEHGAVSNAGDIKFVISFMYP